MDDGVGIGKGIADGVMIGNDQLHIQFFAQLGMGNTRDAAVDRNDKFLSTTSQLANRGFIQAVSIF